MAITGTGPGAARLPVGRFDGWAIAGLAVAAVVLAPLVVVVGSFFSPRPDVFNYLEAGFGKYQTPRAWLSTWSGLSSRAATLDCLPRVTIPTLVIAYTGDNAVFSCDTDAIFAESPAADKEQHRVAGDHLGLGPEGPKDRRGQERALGIITKWLRDRF